jgi:hypothetical protein
LVVECSNDGDGESLLVSVQQEIHWSSRNKLAILPHFDAHAACSIGVLEISQSVDFKATEGFLAEDSIFPVRCKAEGSSQGACLAAIQCEKVGVDSVACGLVSCGEHGAVGVEGIRGREGVDAAVGGVVAVVPGHAILLGHLPCGVDEDPLGVAQGPNVQAAVVVGFKIEITLEGRVLKNSCTPSSSDKRTSILEVVVLVMSGAPVIKVLGFFVVDEAVVVDREVVAELDVTEGVRSHKDVVEISVVPDGGGPAHVEPIGIPGRAHSIISLSISSEISTQPTGEVGGHKIGSKPSMAMACVSLNTTQGRKYVTGEAIGPATATRSHGGVEEKSVEAVGCAISNEVVGVG